MAAAVRSAACFSDNSIRNVSVSCIMRHYTNLALPAITFEAAAARARLMDAIARSPHASRILTAWTRLLEADAAPPTPPQPVVVPPIDVPFRYRRRYWEREMIAEALARSDGNIAAAARALGCSRKAIYRCLNSGSISGGSNCPG